LISTYQERFPGALALFGLVLLSSKLSDKFSALTQGAANFGNQLASTGGDGLLSGVMIGALIGLVWTPARGRSWPSC